MDTPKRATPQRQQQQIGTPLASRYEDSPVFKYINNLSPIKPVKSAHIGQAFHSLNYASMPSVFTSPHIHLQKESRPLIRYPLSDLSKPESSSRNGDESNLCTGVLNTVKVSDCTSALPDGGSIVCYLNEAATGPPDECPTLPVNSNTLPYDCGSPDHNTIPSYGVNSDIKMVMGSTSMIEFIHDGLEVNEAQPEENFEVQAIHDDGQNRANVPECEWDEFSFANGEDLLIFSSTVEPDAPTAHAKKFLDQDSNLSYFPPSLIINAEGTSESCEKLDDEGADSIALGSKVDNHQLRGMRRRCLVFEMSGSLRKSFCGDLNNSSCSYPSHGSFVSDDRQFGPLNSRPTPSPRVLPSIGLHLNSLASTSNDIVIHGSFASTKSLVPVHCSISPLPYINAGQASEHESFPDEKDPGSSEREIQELPIPEDGSQALIVAKVEDSSPDSPKKKRRKTENGGDSDSCKRCNCKKSKCLKLYCECFAAGVYCVEPCSCQGCMNKPMHEDTVLATRKQIESRNPLAFAPKVIRASEPTVESGEEAIKTPASARHKRGCNCKKSSCLKKYCECYQSGVGCSISCRCEGCKNTFGRKNGTTLVTDEIEQDDPDGSEKDADKQDSKQHANVQNNKKQFPESILPITPSFHVSRPFVQLPFHHSTGKPPRLSMLSIGSTPTLTAAKAFSKFEVPASQPRPEWRFQYPPEEENPEIPRGNVSPVCRVKVSSPNSKRISSPHNEAGASPNRKGCRKLILKSIPSFPSLNCDSANEFHAALTNDLFEPSPLG